MSTQADLPTPPPPSLADDPDWDAVDQAAWESFPASDPPSFGSSHAAPSRAAEAQTHAQVDRHVASGRRRARIERALEIALPALGVIGVWALGRRSGRRRTVSGR